MRRVSIGPCRAVVVMAGLAWAAVPAPGQAQQAVPVMVPRGDGQAAACASSTVSGLNPQGDNFLAVRAGPGTDFAMIAQLHTGDVVLTCDARGSWIGILFGPGRRFSGWVHDSFLTDLAG